MRAAIVPRETLDRRARQRADRYLYSWAACLSHPDKLQRLGAISSPLGRIASLGPEAAAIRPNPSSTIPNIDAVSEEFWMVMRALEECSTTEVLVALVHYRALPWIPSYWRQQQKAAALRMGLRAYQRHVQRLRCAVAALWH